jgi:hypothetical protein
MSRLKQFLYAEQTKQGILRLNDRLTFFVDRYLVSIYALSPKHPVAHLYIQIETATQHARINLETFSQPVPQSHIPPPSLIPDNLQWELMSQGDNGDGTRAPGSRILSWREGLPHDLDSIGRVTSRKTVLRTHQRG